MNPGLETQKILNRIKNLEEYEVLIEMPYFVNWIGYIPFELQIVGDQAVAYVLAESQDEADLKVIKFFGATVEYRSEEDNDNDEEEDE